MKEVVIYFILLMILKKSIEMCLVELSQLNGSIVVRNRFFGSNQHTKMSTTVMIFYQSAMTYLLAYHGK